MAKILEFKGNIPRWVYEEFVIYLLEGEWILRTKSGFSTKELLTAAKYAKCRQNASEFGRLSQTCKGLRMALEGILPKKNNLGIVNSLTKYMRSLLAYDTKHVRGERKLASALEDSEGLRLFKGYSFTPDTKIELRREVVDGRLEVRDLVVPEGISWVGFRVHVMGYDWEQYDGVLHSGDWHFERDFTKVFSCALPELEGVAGDLIYLLEVQGFEEKEGEFVGVLGDEKGVFVVDYLQCLPAKLHFVEARGCRGVSRKLETTRNDKRREEARGCRGVSLSRRFGIETTRNDGVKEGTERLKGGILKRAQVKQVQDKATRNDGVKYQECLRGLPAKLHFGEARGCHGSSRMLEPTRNDGGKRRQEVAAAVLACSNLLAMTVVKGGKRLPRRFSIAKVRDRNYSQ